jgi:uncharacterized protein (DUF58 family)
LDARTLLRQIRYRPVTLIPRKRVVSLYPGEWPSPFEGKGFEPLRFRDFAMGDDPRRVHVPTSTRRRRPTIIERVALRDLRVMVVVDPSPSMRVRSKRDVQLAAAALLLYSAWQAETTFGLAVQRGPVIQTFGLGIGSRHFHRLYRTLWALFTGDDRRLAGRRMPLRRSLPPNAMLLYCSDFLAPHGAPAELRAFRKTVHRFDFVPIVIQDEFEYSFPAIPGGTFLRVSNPETGERDEVWISPAEAVRIRALHESRFHQVTTALGGDSSQCIHLPDPDVHGIVKSVDRFFQRRRRRIAS